MKKNTRDISRLQFVTNTTGGDDQRWDNETIQLSCLLRIADAMEAMAKNHNELIARVGYLEKRAASLSDRLASVNRSLVTTKGHLTRLKKKIHEI